MNLNSNKPVTVSIQHYESSGIMCQPVIGNQRCCYWISMLGSGVDGFELWNVIWSSINPVRAGRDACLFSEEPGVVNCYVLSVSLNELSVRESCWMVVVIAGSRRSTC